MRHESFVMRQSADVMKALHRLKAIGYENAIPRGKVVKEIQSEGIDICVRRLKTVAAETRKPSAIRTLPDRVILTSASGLFLPRQEPRERAEDFRVCADFLEKLNLKLPEIYDFRNYAEELEANPDGDLFPFDLAQAQKDAARRKHA